MTLFLKGVGVDAIIACNKLLEGAPEAVCLCRRQGISKNRNTKLFLQNLGSIFLDKLLNRLY